MTNQQRAVQSFTDDGFEVTDTDEVSGDVIVWREDAAYYSIDTRGDSHYLGHSEP